MKDEPENRWIEGGLVHPSSQARRRFLARKEVGFRLAIGFSR